MVDKIYWVWLQSVLSLASNVECIFEEFASPKEIFDADADLIRSCDAFGKRKLDKLLQKDLSYAEQVLEDCQRDGYSLLTPDMPEYPKKLRMIPPFPLVLYYKGDLSLLDDERIKVGVVGTRKPSQYGLDVADSMTISLVENGAVVVSGGALGIDSAAHIAALKRGGKTISIHGCGLESTYLPQNRPLRDQIAEEGLLMSEIPPYLRTGNFGFVDRNRITAGICNGVLVVEAGIKSGSLHTANEVMKYNRDLFVVSGDARGENFYGANELVKKGGRVVFSGADIVSLYGYEIKNRDSFYFGKYETEMFAGSTVYPFGKPDNDKKKSSKTVRKKKHGETAEITQISENTEETEEKTSIDISALSPQAQEVYKLLENEQLPIDEIAQRTQMIIRLVLVALSELEVLGAVECGPGNKYRLK